MCDRSNRPTALRTVAVLIDDRGVLDRHLAAGERHHPRAERDVPLVERRAQEGRRLRHGSSPRPGRARTAARARGAAPPRRRTARWHGSAGERLVGGRTSATSSNSASWSSRLAADGAHEEEVDRLVEARRAADEEVADVDRIGRSISTSRPGLLARLAQRGLLEGLAGVGRALGKRPQRRTTPMNEGDLGCDRRSTGRRPHRLTWRARSAGSATARLRAAGARQPERERGASGRSRPAGPTVGEA